MPGETSPFRGRNCRHLNAAPTTSGPDVRVPRPNGVRDRELSSCPSTSLSTRRHAPSALYHGPFSARATDVVTVGPFGVVVPGALCGLVPAPSGSLGLLRYES